MPKKFRLKCALINVWNKINFIFQSNFQKIVNYTRVFPRQFQKGVDLCLLFPFLPFSKKKKKESLFTNIKYVILLNLKEPLEVKNVPLRISKEPFSYFQHPALF